MNQSKSCKIKISLFFIYRAHMLINKVNRFKIYMREIYVNKEGMSVTK